MATTTDRVSLTFFPPSPYCNPAHESLGVDGEQFGFAATLINGLHDDDQTVVALKAPWMIPQFNHVLVGGESERLFLWMTDRDVRPKPWRTYDELPHAGILWRQRYHFQPRPTQIGHYRLTEFSIEGHQESLYWLLFRPLNPLIFNNVLPRFISLTKDKGQENPKPDALGKSRKRQRQLDSAPSAHSGASGGVIALENLLHLARNDPDGKIGKVAGAITLMSRAIPNTNNSHSGLVIVPQKQLARKSDM
ncbi:unnamed protein product [Arabidopsis arenosa]|uniref:Uncharacterized protein n=1 Tax=Arabidopsis arenosa TaxID=38785 RepID=A0A8S2A8X9_ARAAE|nr:unnamed protein product [Arabidopsis arenosa]